MEIVIKTPPNMKHTIYDKDRNIQIHARYFGNNVWVSGHVGEIKFTNSLCTIEEFFKLLLEIKQFRKPNVN